MDVTQVILGALLPVAIVISIAGFAWMSRRLDHDAAVDAATFLAVRELRERFERPK